MKRNPGRIHCSIMVFLVALPLLLGSCSTWKQISVPTDAVLWNEHPRQVRATLVDRRVVTIRDAQFVGDTLHGQHRTLIQESDGKYAWVDSMAIPADQIVSLKVRRTSAGRTILLILASIPIGLLIGVSMGGPILK